MSGLRVVLLGVIGSGKTVLFNNLTKNQEPIRAGGGSVTKKIVVGECVYGEQFQVIDTPGFEADEDKLLHAAGVIAALSIGDVNRILIITKFERNGRMFGALQQVISPITRFRENVTILVSHWDHSENKEEDYKQLQKKIKDRFNIGSILCYSKNDDPKIIALQILKIISESQLITIKLQDTEIYSQFDLLSLNYQCQDQLLKDQENILKEFRKTANIFSQFIDKEVNLDNPKAVEILHQVSLEIKNIANNQIEQFEKQHGDKLNEFYDTNGVNVQYLHHIYLKKEIKKDLENVQAIIKLAQQKMTNSKNHCFQFLKQCPNPNCKLVWIKVAGCDKITTCGNRVYSFQDDVLKKSSYEKKKYQIKISSNKLIVEEVIQGDNNDNNNHNNNNNNNNNDNNDNNDNNKSISLQVGIYKLLKEDQKLKKILGENFTQDQLINLLNQKMSLELKEFLNRYSFQNYSLRDFIFSLILEELEQVIIQTFEEQNKKKIKLFGCGQKLDWEKLPPLSGPELNELLNIELIDYFSDQAQQIDDESKFLEKTYKDLVNQAIQEQFKNKKMLQQQSIQ